MRKEGHRILSKLTLQCHLQITVDVEREVLNHRLLVDLHIVRFKEVRNQGLQTPQALL